MASSTLPWKFAGKIKRTVKVQKKETSKHLKVKQILAFSPKGVCSAPSQSAKTLLHNLVNFSPYTHIDPLKT
jgi:hypothetical protein